MSDSTTPENPSPAPRPATAQALRSAARAAARAQPPRPISSTRPPLATVLQFLGVLVLAVHLLFGRKDFDLINRLFAVVPAFPVLWEINRYHKGPRSTQMPFGIYALFFYYITFSFPALFNTEFFDLSGPVVFTDSARFQGTASIALSDLLIYAGFRLGEGLGRKLQPSLLRIYPPQDIPSSYSRAVGWYALGCVGVTQFVSLGSRFPAAFGLLATMVFSFSFVVGAVMVKPESFRGPWSRHFISGVVAYGTVSGLLRGVMEPLFRLTIVALTARWVYLRRFSVVLVVAMLAIYIAFQPAKAKFRQQTWTVRGSEQLAGYTERVEAWQFAFEDLWSRRDATESTSEATASRFLELDPVLHAFMMIPGRVRSGEGAAWLNILYAPIPRIVWADKPVSTDLDQNYGVAFNRQNELAARSTALMLPLVVDGYWNFGWPGIAVVSLLTGLWIGTCQTMYSGDHWALKASGVAMFSLITVSSSFTLAFSGITQEIIGVLLASWIVYWLARLMKAKERQPRGRLPQRRPLPASRSAPIPGAGFERR